jgi:hypothetical protein
MTIMLLYFIKNNKILLFGKSNLNDSRIDMKFGALTLPNFNGSNIKSLLNL